MWRGARWCGVVVVRVLVLGGLVGLSACVHSEAERVVVGQNAGNVAALAGNIEALSAAVRESSRVECEVMVRRARERVAGELVRVRATITLMKPTEAEVGDAGAAWVVAIQKEVEVVRGRVEAATVEGRPAVARSLAEECAATIDVAVGTAGFTVSRVLRDAVEMDRVNEMIEAERNMAVRAGLMSRRDAIVDGYLAVRVAVEATGRYRGAMEEYLASVSEQAKIAGVHAASLQAAASGGGVGRAAVGVLGNQDVRAAVLEIVSREWGSGVAADVRERLDRVQRVIEGK